MNIKLMNFLTIAMGVMSIGISLTSLNIVRSITSDGSVIMQENTTIVDGKEPVLATLTVIDSITFGGNPENGSYVDTVRDKSYVCKHGNKTVLFYSPYFQTLKTDDTLSGWFVIPTFGGRTTDYGRLAYYLPIEVTTLSNYTELQ